MLSLSYPRTQSVESFSNAESNKKFGLKSVKKWPQGPVIDMEEVDLQALRFTFAYDPCLTNERTENNGIDQ